MHFLIDSITCGRKYDHEVGVVQTYETFTVDLYVYMTPEADEDFSISVELEDSYGLTLSEIESKAIELAKEKIKAASAQA
ncbi:hypothetical protein Xsto_03302 [Xenorhabdus stockiae]|uniref:Uncharacterized protein n=1 Tax=Xenorhabdus stockiae TaxID=351614 RepID=A0A2D0KLA1_9GAMM|nr:hypothetical protein [Xenorhabdus stockiae]PHM64105.1 hypothetical protein Xsto_03302 [Xenorhabdus stockiae]